MKLFRGGGEGQALQLAPVALTPIIACFHVRPYSVLCFQAMRIPQLPKCQERLPLESNPEL